MNFIFTGIWIIPFGYEVFWLSLIVTLCSLGTLIWIYHSVAIGASMSVVKACSGESVSDESEIKNLLPEDEADSVKAQLLMYWALHFPFSLYLGWITVNTLTNFAILLKYYGITTYAAEWSIALQAVVFFY